MTTVLERAGAPSADVGFKTPPAYVREWAQDHPGPCAAMREKDFGIWQEYTWAQTWELDPRRRPRAARPRCRRRAIGSRSTPRTVPSGSILDLATVAVRGITVGLYPTNPAAEVEYLLDRLAALRSISPRTRSRPTR